MDDITQTKYDAMFHDMAETLTEMRQQIELIKNRVAAIEPLAYENDIESETAD